MEKSKHSRIDYRTLIDLASTRNIRFVEARGLDTRRGIRFRKDGSDWIAVDSDLPAEEKIRTLVFLLENDPVTMAAKVGLKSDFSSAGAMIPVLTLCCPSK
jgi:hypothetical protein